MKKLMAIGQAMIIGMTVFVFQAQSQVIIDKAEMTPVTIGGIPYLVMENIPFVQNGDVSFLGFDQDLTTMLRPDLFENISDNTATFVGQSRYWRAFYNTANEFMYLQTYNNEEGLLWLAGLGAGFPLPPYAATSDWFETEAHGYFSFKRTGTDIYEMLAYLNEDMAFQVYRKVMWNMVVSPMVSLTPSLLTIQANNDAVPGPDFVSGVYNLKVNVDAGTVELIPYSELSANKKQYLLEGLSTNIEQSLLENRSIYYKDNHLVIINPNNIETNSLVYIIDMNGRILKQQVIGSAYETAIDISNIIDGVYIVRIEGEQPLTQKFIKK